jgi:hypothetical protein
MLDKSQKSLFIIGRDHIPFLYNQYMTIKQTIPKNIQVTVKRLKSDLHVCYLKHNLTQLSTWFLFEDTYCDHTFKKAIATISVGYTRKLVLRGVGFKADLISDGETPILSLKIGKKQPCNSIVPEHVHIFIEGNIVHAWAPNVSVIDNMFFKILKNKAIKKGTITISN